MVAVVGFSSACLWDCLRLFVVVKSELRRRGLVGNDDRHEVVCSVVLTPLALHSSPSLPFLRIGAALSSTLVVELWHGSSSDFTQSL